MENLHWFCGDGKDSWVYPFVPLAGLERGFSSSLLAWFSLAQPTLQIGPHARDHGHLLFSTTINYFGYPHQATPSHNS